VRRERREGGKDACFRVISLPFFLSFHTDKRMEGLMMMVIHMNFYLKFSF